MAYKYTWFDKARKFLFRDLPNFFNNIWKFRKALWDHHWWDYRGTLHFIEIGINDISEGIKTNGIEIKQTRMKKVAKMKRVVEILRNIREDRYFDIVEAEMGRGLNGFNYDFVPCEDKPGFLEMVDLDSEEEQLFKDKYFERVRILEETEWNELWDILKGPDYSKLDRQKNWEEQIDGSGLNSWWD
jgi:hypothetical protein